MEEQEPQAPTFSRREMLIGRFKQQERIAQAREQTEHAPVFPEEDLAAYIAAMAQYWRQSKQEHLPGVEQLHAQHIQPLEQRATNLATTHPQRAPIAHLLSQSYQLLGILLFHRNDVRQRVRFCQQAVAWAQEAHDPHLLVAALLKLGVSFYYADLPQQAEDIYQSALAPSEKVSPLLQSSLWMKWAATSAQMGQEREALACLEKAYRIFPAHPEQDLAFLYADCGSSSLALWDGLTHLALAENPTGLLRDLSHVQHACEAFHPSVQQPEGPWISQRNHLETVNHQALAATLLGDLEMTEHYLTQGIVGARSLNSARRFAEALKGYRQARIHWPEERRIRRLAGLFIEDLP